MTNGLDKLRIFMAEDVWCSRVGLLVTRYALQSAKLVWSIFHSKPFCLAPQCKVAMQSAVVSLHCLFECEVKIWDLLVLARR